MSRPRRFALAAALCAIAATVLGLLGAPAVPATAPPAAVASVARPSATHSVHLQWRRCKSVQLRYMGAQCAILRVPVNYAHRSGVHIRLALARVRHTVPHAQYRGVMLTNPGGPGGAGRYLAGLGGYVPGGIGAAYDWIGIDPRGVGASRPALHCKSRYFRVNRPNYDPRKPADLHAWLARTKHYTAACAHHNGALLYHMTTADAARDLDSIRKALHVRQINYYGFSYGTYLGQVYATLFPTRVNRMVLDSSVNPTRIWYRANLDQDRAFERNARVWFGWLATNNATYHLGATATRVEHRWFHIRYKLAAHPDHGIGPDEWTDLFLDSQYFQSTWLDQARLFAGYVHQHDYQAIRHAYVDSSKLGNDNEFAVYNAVQCTDAQWPTSWQKWATDNRRVNRNAPFETWANAWYNAPCLYWPSAAAKPVTITGKGAPRALLIDETRDAATPYSGSLEVRRLFRHSRLVALPGGTSHANSLSGDACLDNKVAAYLRSGHLPARKPGNRADATCGPLPRPRP